MSGKCRMKSAIGATPSSRYAAPLRLVATRANGQPAFGCYFPSPHTDVARPYGLLVLTLAGSGIAEITWFADSSCSLTSDSPHATPTPNIIVGPFTDKEKSMEQPGRHLQRPAKRPRRLSAHLRNVDDPGPILR